MCAIDLGTDKLKAATINKHDVFHYNQIYPVHFNDTSNCAEYWLPMKAAFLEGEFYFGFELEALVDDERIQRENIIHGFKMLLYESNTHESDARMRRVQEQLAAAGKSIEDLFTEVLRYVWNQIVRERHVSPEDAQNIEVLLTCPKVVTPWATRTLAQAAKRAGLPPRVRFASEPLSAAACVVAHSGAWAWETVTSHDMV
jgi:molecular chaperone DnaK (HSP70)